MDLKASRLKVCTTYEFRAHFLTWLGWSRILVLANYPFWALWNAAPTIARYRKIAILGGKNRNKISRSTSDLSRSKAYYKILLTTHSSLKGCIRYIRITLMLQISSLTWDYRIKRLFKESVTLRVPRSNGLSSR